VLIENKLASARPLLAYERGLRTVMEKDWSGMSREIAKGSLMMGKF
jgi:hypothetical protein